MKEPPIKVYYSQQGADLRALRPISTQTEIKRGWDIQSINVGRKTIRYISGKEAVLVTSERPTFHIFPENQLNDYALIKLLGRKNYRVLPQVELAKGEFLSIDIHHFIIENLPDMGFSVTPINALLSGNYILVNLNAPPLNEYGDIEVYDFTVEK